MHPCQPTVLTNLFIFLNPKGGKTEPFCNLSFATMLRSRTGILRGSCSKIYPFADPKARTQNSREEFWWIFSVFNLAGWVQQICWKFANASQGEDPTLWNSVLNSRCSMISGKICMHEILCYHFLWYSPSWCWEVLSALISALNYRYTWSNKVKTRIKPHKNLAYSMYQKKTVVPRLCRPSEARGCAITQQRLKFLTKTGTSLKM